MRCSAVECTNSSEKGYKLYIFPQNKALKLKWAEKINRQTPNKYLWVPPSTSGCRLCEIHFSSNQYTTNSKGRKVLKADAVPDLNLPLNDAEEAERKLEKENSSDLEPHHGSAAQIEPHHGSVDQIELHHGSGNQFEHHHSPVNHVEPHHGPVNHVEPHHGPVNHVEPHHELVNHVEPHHGPVNHVEPHHESVNHVEPHHVSVNVFPPAKGPTNCVNYKVLNNNHLTLVLESLAGDEHFMDVTLTAQGKSIKAHKSVLSAVSPYFRSVLKENPCQHPIIIMPRDIKFKELYNIISYVYKGEITVAGEELPSLLKTAEILEVIRLGTSGTVGSTQDIPSGFHPANSTSDSSSRLKNYLTSKTPSKNSVHHVAPSEVIEEPQVTVKHSESQETSDHTNFPVTETVFIKKESPFRDEEMEESIHLTAEPNLTNNYLCAGSSREQSTVMDLADMTENDVEMNINHKSLNVYSSQEDNSLSENEFKIFFPRDKTMITSEYAHSSRTVALYVCPHCPEMHRPIEALELHLHRNHPNSHSFFCGCGRVFANQSSFNSHMIKCAG